VGSGIFGLPSLVAGYVGRWSPVAYLIAAAYVAVIIACFAEVASQFGESGGPYLYAREAFGNFLGIEAGWLLWLVRLAAAAAAANLFTNYLAEFWPEANEPWPRLAALTVLIGFLALVNCRGVKSGALASNVFTVAKLSALSLFAITGVAFVLRAHTAMPGASAGALPIPPGNWFEALMVVSFAYGGFEAALLPMAEAENPRRDVPFALFAGLLITSILYCLIQYVVVAVVPAAAATDRPLTIAARAMWGALGAGLITSAALISIFGYLSAQMLHTPRLIFAMGEHRDFPALFSRIHARYSTPHVSILIFAGIVWILAALGNFKWNVIISSAARLFVYGLVCSSLPILRRKNPNASAHRIPAANFAAAIGIIFTLVFVSRMRLSEWIVIVVTMVIAFVNWLWARNRVPDRAHFHQGR